MRKNPQSILATFILAVCGLMVGFCANGAAPSQLAVLAEEKPPTRVPQWLFPPNTPAHDETVNPEQRFQIPGSRASYTVVELTDRFSAPDWFPESHSKMPPVVALGRKPALNACGFCHTPGGQGRPENASLAGLPAAYIVQQVADFKSGARRSPAAEPYAPTDLMIDTAMQATLDEVRVAADYFSRQRPISRVRVVEADRVPRSQVRGFVYSEDAQGGDEPLGARLLEFTPDPMRHEERDDQMQYVAYVPKGSIARGRSMALAGATGRTVACVGCHGEQLQGIGPIPRLAGRSPTYLLRQMLAFKAGKRTGASGQPMLPVVSNLNIDDMIDAVSYAASLQP